MLKGPFFIFLNLILLSIQSHGLCVSVEQANLRATPSATAEKVWTVGKYMPFIELSQKGAWVEVKDLDGHKMWIHRSLVTDNFDCAVIKVRKTNLRKEPDVKSPQSYLKFAYKYTPFKKIGREGEWLYLQDDFGFKHWVIENNLWEPLSYSRLRY